MLNNPIRDRKIGMSATDENGLPLNPGAPTPRQQQEAAQGALLQTGGVVPQPQQVQIPNQNVFSNGGGVIGRFEQPVSPQQPYMGDMADKTKQPETSFENIPPIPQPQTGFEKIPSTILPDGSERYDDISKALAGYQNQPQFNKDDSQRDGGFFSWLRGLIPKSRPGRRDGESDDDYDRRMTDNRERLLALGDAMRHIGNIVNTSKGAPAQQFNDPFTAEETRYQQRKADRDKKAALETENARNASEMSLKEKAAEADRQYKMFLMGMKNEAAGLNRDKFDYQKVKDANEFGFKQTKEANDGKYKTDKLNETIRHNKANEIIAQNRVIIAQYNATHKSSNGSGKYPVLYDENGNIVYSYNKTSWEYNSSRYAGVQDDKTSTSTTTKNTPIGKQTTTTVTKIGPSAASQLGARDRNKTKQAPSKKPSGKTSGKGGYTHTKALGW